MNRDLLLSHLREAAEELSQTIAALAHDPEYDDAALEVALRHTYHHLNTAWNARELTYPEYAQHTVEQFY